MPKYTIRDKETGKKITFNWNGEQPPTEQDMAQIVDTALGSSPKVEPVSMNQDAMMGQIQPYAAGQNSFDDGVQSKLIQGGENLGAAMGDGSEMLNDEPINPPDPREVARAGIQLVPAAAGGVIGAGAGPGGAMAGGALGYAIGNKIADMTLGDRPASEPGASPTKQVEDQLIQSAKDLATGAFYELAGMGLSGTGRMLEGIFNAGRNITRNGFGKAATNAVDRFAEKRAAQRIAETQAKTPEMKALVEQNLEENAQLQDQIPGFQFNRAQAQGDPNMLSVARQKSLQPGYAAEVASMGPAGSTPQNQALVDYIQSNIRGGGNADDFLNSLRSEKLRLEEQSAKANEAANTVGDFMTNEKPQEIGRQLFDQATESKRASGKIAKKLYSEVPDDLQVDSAPLKNKVDEILADYQPGVENPSTVPLNQARGASRVMEENVQDQIQSWLDMNIQVDGASPKLTMKQLKEFRSWMGNIQRNPGSNPKLAYKAGQLKDAVNETLSEASKTGNKEAVDALQAATDYWKNVHIPIYRQGATGAVLRPNMRGEYVPASSIPGKYFRSGEGAAEAADSFVNTFGGSKEANGLMNDYAGFSLLEAAKNPKTGMLESGRIKTWMAKYKVAIDKLGMQDRFGNLQKATEAAEEARKVEKIFNMSAFGKAIEADPEQAIGQILSSGAGRVQATSRLKVLASIAKKDPSGAALKGLKAAIGDHFRKQTVITTSDLKKAELESLHKLRGFMETYYPALKRSGIYTEKELRAFENVHRAIKVIAKQQTPHTGYSNSTTFELLARMAAGGASIAVGKFGVYGAARTAASALEIPLKKKIDEAVARALFDPQYADVIMQFGLNLKKMPAEKAAQRLNSHLVSLGLLGASRAQDINDTTKAAQ